ncbi:hypothetical protein COU57_00380 [Candidatus Pacearchaeota archaeon CG10_big_fil_rev_8_21_14_0_10_32_14]|nr:MAG: hypothetical protein COU57_00380 [Candidatus Pacearchaeota archaeon CG10_big_fil_rev_8_21_14_0_10_32_14]
MIFSIVPPEIFPSGIHATIFSIIFLLFFAIEFKILINQKLFTDKDRDSLIFILIAIALSFLILFYLAYFKSN